MRRRDCDCSRACEEKNGLGRIGPRYVYSKSHVLLIVSQRYYLEIIIDLYVPNGNI